MTIVTKNPLQLLARLLAERAESDWLEFKQNNSDPEMIGRCVSACANGAMLAGKERAFIVFGIDAARIPQCLAGGYADSTLLQAYWPRMVERDFAARGRDYLSAANTYMRVVTQFPADQLYVAGSQYWTGFRLDG